MFNSKTRVLLSLLLGLSLLFLAAPLAADNHAEKPQTQCSCLEGGQCKCGPDCACADGAKGDCQCQHCQGKCDCADCKEGKCDKCDKGCCVKAKAE